MHKIFPTLLLAILMMCAVLPVSGRGKKEAKDSNKPTQIVYVYGVSQDLGDTIVYFSSITPVAGATLKAHNELENRLYYSEQFKKYVEAKYGSPRQTVAVVYGRKLKDVEKRFKKMEEKIRKKSPYPPTLKYVRPEDFHFKVPVIVQAEDDNF